MEPVTLIAVGGAAYLLLKPRTTTIVAGQTNPGTNQANSVTNSMLKALQQLLKPQPKSSGSGGGSSGGIGGGSGSSGGSGGFKGTGLDGTGGVDFKTVSTTDPQGIAVTTGQPFRVPGGVWNPDGTFIASTVQNTPVGGFDMNQEIPGTGQTVGELYDLGYSTNDIASMLNDVSVSDPFSAGTPGFGIVVPSSDQQSQTISDILGTYQQPDVQLSSDGTADPFFSDSSSADSSGGIIDYSGYNDPSSFDNLFEY